MGKVMWLQCQKEKVIFFCYEDRKESWEQLKKNRFPSVLKHLGQQYKDIWKKHDKIQGDELFFHVSLDWLSALTDVGEAEI